MILCDRRDQLTTFKDRLDLTRDNLIDRTHGRILPYLELVADRIPLGSEIILHLLHSEFSKVKDASSQ